MDRMRVKCLQVGLIVALIVFLGVNAKPLPLPDIAPQLTAGASKLPITDWRTTEVKVTEPDPEIIKVAEPPAEQIIEEPEEPAAGQEETTIEPQEEPTEAAGDEIDLLYRTVQAEGYTMGVEGMRYITDAILNLARSRGCSIYEVLTSGAYTVVNNGQIWRESIYPETIAAVDAELGGQLDYEIKYFRTNHFHGFGTPQFAYGNVYFSS